jgi:hypothetical protein
VDLKGTEKEKGKEKNVGATCNMGQDNHGLFWNFFLRFHERVSESF